MYNPSNRAQYRDEIRRSYLGQIPPIDDGSGIAGAQPSRYPFPTNPQLNAVIDRSVAHYSRYMRLGGDPLPRLLPVAPQSANGPMAINLQIIAPVGSINSNRRIMWQPFGGQEQTMTPSNRDDLDRSNIDWMNQTPATPSRYWIEEGYLVIWPAPNSAGSISAMFDRALWQYAANPPADGDQIEVIPQDWIPLVLMRAARYWCISQPDNAELRAMIPIFDHDLQDVQSGEPAMQSFFARRNRSYEAKLVPDTTRITGIPYGNR